jgi:dihydroorotate dehydrogenase (NAD+) catalytic subunit
MLTLPNGVQFSCIASAGSRGWAGGDEGHGLARGWKWPWSKLWPNIPVVTKTLTRLPRKGNLTFWRPWRCVRPIPGSRWGGLINAVGLTNPGLEGWIGRYHPKVQERPYPVFVSIQADTPSEATWMTSLLDLSCAGIAGIELNLSCPNTCHAGGGGGKTSDALKIYSACRETTSLPVIPKLGWYDDYVLFCRKVLEEYGSLPAVHLINTLPWPAASVGPSPLARYGLVGGVSGRPLVPYARMALRAMTKSLPQVPVISGGGVMDTDEAVTRMGMGAATVSLGSVYLLRPWRVRGIINSVNGWSAGQERCSSNV